MTFKLEDGVTFVHIAFMDEGEPALPGLAAFRDFRDGLAERCDEPPVSTRLDRIGEYRMLGLAVAG